MGSPDLLAFFLIMLALAAMPSASVALVVARSATHGVPNGLAAAGGIVLGDLVFVALALAGMTFLAHTMGAFFSVLKYAGAAWLMWLGITLLRAKTATEVRTDEAGGSALASSAAAGLLLTLGDVKAILFYASLFPALFDLASLAIADVVSICGMTILTVGGVKAAYAMAAARIARRLRGRALGGRGRVAVGGALVGAGVYLVVKT